MNKICSMLLFVSALLTVKVQGSVFYYNGENSAAILKVVGTWERVQKVVQAEYLSNTYNFYEFEIIIATGESVSDVVVSPGRAYNAIDRINEERYDIWWNGDNYEAWTTSVRWTYDFTIAEEPYTEFPDPVDVEPNPTTPAPPPGTPAYSFHIGAFKADDERWIYLNCGYDLTVTDGPIRQLVNCSIIDYNGGALESGDEITMGASGLTFAPTPQPPPGRLVNTGDINGAITITDPWQYHLLIPDTQKAYIYKISGSPGSTIALGDRVAIKAKQSGYWSYPSSPGAVTATATSIGLHEVFMWVQGANGWIH